MVEAQIRDGEPATPDAPARARRAPGRFRRWVRHMFDPRLAFGGLAVALVFFWISLTPSLLPRAWVFQGVVSGLSAVIGYGIGSGSSALLRQVLPAEPHRDFKRIAWWILAASAGAGSVLMLWQSRHWQHDLRQLMGIDDEAAFSGLGIVVLAAFVGALVLVGARVVRSFTRFLIRQVDRIAPRPVSVVVGIALALVVIVGLFQGFFWRGAVAGLNEASSTVNGRTNEGTEQPTTPERSGGPGSLVRWDSLGRQGREFVGQGPSVADLEAFHGAGCCEAPIRVYAGLDSADSASERAELAVEELARTGAFDRSVLGVFAATGTGWINPRVADALEYINEGDTAEVSMQYSFLPSWMSFLVDQSKAAEAGEELIDAVLAHVDTLPAGARPKVLLFGESLGSYGTEAAFADLAEMRARVDGALLVGPTFANPMWQDLTDTRDAGSSEWLPTVSSEPGVHFARTPDDLAGVSDGNDGPRVIYLQNASDPITWWNLELAYRKPDWAGAPAAPDRAPAFRWFPIVTFAQVGVDLVDSLGVPAGHGHYFGTNVVDGWVAVYRPAGWTDADTAEVREILARADD